MSEKMRIGETSDLPPGERTFITVDGKSVCVLNHEGEYFAFVNECCHDSGPIGNGKITQEIKSRQPKSGEAFEEYFGERNTITCPWHGWAYYLDTGIHIGNSDIELETFEISVEGSELYLEK